MRELSAVIHSKDNYITLDAYKPAFLAGCNLELCLSQLSGKVTCRKADIIKKRKNLFSESEEWSFIKFSPKAMVEDFLRFGESFTHSRFLKSFSEFSSIA